MSLARREYLRLSFREQNFFFRLTRNPQEHSFRERKSAFFSPVFWGTLALLAKKPLQSQLFSRNATVSDPEQGNEAERKKKFQENRQLWRETPKPALRPMLLS